jgi:hypothetical protein
MTTNPQPTQPEQEQGEGMSNSEYRALRGKPVLCLKCNQRCSAISWDFDPPYSICHQAPVVPFEEPPIVYRGSALKGQTNA